VSGGPKNYAYRVLAWYGREKIVCKVRGISLNYNASKLVNFDVIRDMTLKWNKGDEPSDLNVHTGKNKRKGSGEVKPYLLLFKPKIKCIQFHFPRVGDKVTIVRPVWV